MSNMTAQNFTLFDTAVGPCGIVWGSTGVVAVQLPERHAAATRARLLRRYPAASETPPPPDIQYAIDAIVALLGGEKRDLTGIAVDLADMPAFHQRVYEVARGIPPGATLTYGEIATRLGDRLAAREVGEALGQNPIPIIVPCHRVLAAGGKVGGFSAAGGVTTKLRLLDIEGAQIGERPTLFDSLPLMVRRTR